ncbi:MAG: substrate-binding domain-containing protein [Cyanobacteria bacterium P01_F01_bin.150]
MIKTIVYPFLIGGTFLSLASCGTSPPPEELSEDMSPIQIGGSAEVYDVLESLAEAYKAQSETVEFTFLPPSQTSGGISGVQKKLMDIGGVSRKPTPEETDNQLTYLPLVQVPLVLVAHESVTGVSDISAEQIKAIYQGDIRNWQELGGPDAEIVLFDFTEDENEKQELRRAYLGADLKVTPTAIVFAEDDELLDIASITDFSMAAVPLEDELDELPMTILRIDGVAPSRNTLEDETYGMKLPLGIVLSLEPAPNVEAFVNFVTSTEGQQALAETEYLTIESAQ